jgi:AraC-like DNA-binding protein
MQPTLISTDSLGPAEGVQMWCDLVCRTLVSLDVIPAEPDHFFGAISSADVGRLTVTNLVSRPQDAYRTPRLISHDSQRYFKIALLAEGECVVAQHGREARLASGDLVCYDTGAPYAFHMETPFRLAVFMIPATGVEHRLRDFDKATAISIDGDKGLGRVASSTLNSVLMGVGPSRGSSDVHVGDAVTDLVAALVAQIAGRVPDEDAARAALMGRAHRFIELNLGDPDLSPSAVAVQVGISVRYLYRLFEHENTTVSAWIRDRRLDNAARDLADPHLVHRTVAGVGARWGFHDPTHFSRVFRLREGISPREFRERALRMTTG